MNESKHTAGEASRTAYGVWVGNVMIADCRPDNGKSVYRPRDEDESVANADRLSACWNACDGLNPAAVPGLLAALQFIVNDAPAGEDAQLTVKGYNMACAAIAAATE